MSQCDNTGKTEFLCYTRIMENEEKKVTNEKPISLKPLNFKEALAAFMKVKPATKEEMDEAIKEAEEKEEKNGQ